MALQVILVSTPPLQQEEEWVTLCSNKTSLTKIGGRCQVQFADSCFLLLNQPQCVINDCRGFYYINSLGCWIFDLYHQNVSMFCVHSQFIRNNFYKWHCISRGSACEAVSVMSESLQPYGMQPTRLLCPWDSPGKNTGVGYHFLLQGIFLTQGSNPGLPRWRQTL